LTVIVSEHDDAGGALQLMPAQGSFTHWPPLQVHETSACEYVHEPA
jgi:hypothetical protein